MSDPVYAAQIEDGVVVWVTVGDAQWAIDNLGGLWIQSPDKVGLGWLWNETDGFQYPV